MTFKNKKAVQAIRVLKALFSTLLVQWVWVTYSVEGIALVLIFTVMWIYLYQIPNH